MLDNQALTQILAIQIKSVFATCLPLFGRKVVRRHLASKHMTGYQMRTAMGRQKRMVFDAANPMIAAAIIRLCRQVNDPLNLSEYQNINLQFE